MDPNQVSGVLQQFLGSIFLPLNSAHNNTSMDRSWMDLPRLMDAYKEGVQLFLDFAVSNSHDGLILCPCIGCKNGISRERKSVETHLITKGFVKGYTKWVLHGESISESVPLFDSFVDTMDTTDNMWELLHDRFPLCDEDPLECTSPTENEAPNEEAEKFYRLLKDAEQELYPGCKDFSKLSFLVRLLQIKALGNWSDKSFSMLLDLLRESFPQGVQLPKNYYESRKTLRDLGLNYQKIDSCTNDCMIYWGVHESKTSCDTCGESRWKKVQNAEIPGIDHSINKTKETKVPNKSFWYFPLKPRLQRLFMSSKIASQMQWHANERTDDGIMRHPADSPAWQTFDHNHSDFAKEPRNVRLGLFADGFSPFRTMMVNHSTWPVVLMPYNLPPGECMKKSFFMLSTLIPGPNEPGNNIDVYLEPLIMELKELWDVEINTYDASQKQNFQMRAALMWTISDLPGLANLSGWSTKGKYACPVCMKHTNSEYLKNSHKQCYMGHRTFLPREHPYRSDSSSFDGAEEHREAPLYPSSSEVFDEVKHIENKFGKLVRDQQLPYNWKKRSIFYVLPYWESNLLRHSIDVMHDEKNVCDKLLYTMLGSEKSKDNMNARLDLKDKGIRSGLHPFKDENGKEWLPASCFEFDKQEKLQFCKVLKSVKVQDGYASNISKNVQLKPPKVSINKSHDSHILMQQLMPVALRNLLPTYVRSPIIRLCKYFRELCSKSLRHSDLLQMEQDIPVILCQLEKIFPPSFFDITVHITVHLVTEAKLGGPVYYRWMYPPERYLCTLKSYVRNKGQPEGSIAAGYLAEECLSFCSLYLDENVETRHNRVDRNDEGECINNESLKVFSMAGRPLWKGEPVVFDKKKLEKAHRYVLFNCEEINSKLDEHEAMIRRKKRRSPEHEIRRIHSEGFSSWLSTQVIGSDEDDINKANQSDIACLAKGPVHVGKRYKGYIVNGFRFHTREIERKRKTQNCGVVVHAATTSFASKKDKNPISSELTYYGIVKDIIELWRAFKNRIKQKYFDPEATMEKNLRNKGAVDERVKEDHWKFLVEYWCRQEAKDISEKNKENRSMKKMQHITGKKSFAQVFEVEKAAKGSLNNDGLNENDMDVEENDELEMTELSRADIFAKCYSRDGNTSNPQVANALEKMKELKSQMSPGARDEGPNDIYSQVFGEDKGGRARMYGYGVTLTEVYGGNSLEQDDDMEKENLKRQLEEKDKIIERLLRNEAARNSAPNEPVRNSALGNSYQFSILEKSILNFAPENSARVSSAEKAAHISGPEKSARMSSVEKSAHISTSEKSARMSSAEKSSHISAPAKSVRMSSAEKSSHISAPEKSSRISAPEKSAFHGLPSESALPPNANFLQVGRKVILKALVGNDIIGKGFVESMDPSKIVGKEELGPDWCEVKVIVAMKPEQRLLRTNGNVKVIGKAIGSSIAWPQHLVQVERPS